MRTSFSKSWVDKFKPTDEEKWEKMGGSLYLVISKKTKTGKGSKRFVGMSSLGTNPRKKYKVSLGVWNKDVYNPEEVIAKWNEMKVWGKANNRDLRDYFCHSQIIQTTKLFSDVCKNFLETKKEKKSFKSIKNRLNQIQGYLNGRELITDFQGNSGRAYIKQTVLDPKIASGTEYTAHRFRRLLNQVFEYAVLEQGLQPEYLPYRLDIPFKFEKDVKEKQHPHLKWEEFKKELLPKLSSNDCPSGRLVNLVTKASLLTLTRVSSLVCWRWDWLDTKENVWVIPSETTGLKRDIKFDGDEKYNHYIPNTPLLETLLNNLYSINGNKEYVFYSPHKGNNPFLSSQTPNDHLIQLGFKGRQDAHGFRHLASNKLIDDEGFDEGLVGKCLGHKNEKGVMKNYLDAKYLKQKRKVFETWHQILIKDGLKI